MRAMWEELRRACKLSFVDGLRAIRSGSRHHPGFLSDPHLRKGFFFAGPTFLGLTIAILSLMRHPIALQPGFLFVFVIPVALLGNLLWFGISASSRARSKQS